jgi:hypothetical protein
VAGILNLGYGELTHAGIARKPFLVPLSVNFPLPVSPFDTYVSLVDGGAADLHISLTLDAYDLSTGHVQIGLTLKPLPGRTVADMQFRLLLWLADDLLTTNVQGNTVAPGDHKYVALGYSTNGGQPMSPQVDFLIDQITQSHEGVRCDHYTISASTPGHPDPMNVTGGKITGPQVVLSGVATTYDVINHAYTEPGTPLRGIDLERALPSPSPSATSPSSGVWADVGIANTGTTDTRFRFDIYTPSTPDKPATDPQWEADATASTLRAGNYQYAVAFKAHSGNESGTTTTGTVAVPAAGNRSVMLTSIPDAPISTDSFLKVDSRVVYRTEVSADDPSGDMVMIGEVPGATGGTFRDSGDGPEASQTEASPPTLVFSWMEFGFATQCSLDLDGAVSVLSKDSIDRYTGAVDGVPQSLAVRMNARAAHAIPSPEPRLLWRADAATPRVVVGLESFAMDGWGTGLSAELLDVPVEFGIDWLILGDGFTGVTIVGAPGVAEPPATSTTIGHVAVRLGGVTPPSGWPRGEATLGIDLAQTQSIELLHPPATLLVDPGWWRINARGLRFAQLRVGDVADPVTNAGRLRGLAVIGADPDDPPGGDRDLRVRFRPKEGMIEHLLARARELPDRVELDAFLRDHTDGGVEYSLIAQLSSRLRYVRAAVALRDVMAVPSATVNAEIDDTGESLGVRVDKLDGKIAVEGAQRLGLRADVRGLPLVHPIDDPSEVHAEAMVPLPVTIDTTGVIQATVSEPGLSGRVGMGWSPGVLTAASATPQVRVYQRGPDGALSDPAPGSPRALTGRVYGLTDVRIVTSANAEILHPSRRADLQVHVEQSKARPNNAIRAVGRELDHRYVDPSTSWDRTPEDIARFDDRQRTWLRGQIAGVPDVLDLDLIRWQGDGDDAPNEIAGLALIGSSAWGSGAIWCEPGSSFGVDPRAPDKGMAFAVGNLRADIDAVPATVRVLMLKDAEAFTSTELDPASNRFPSVEAPPLDWVSGGVALLTDGPLRLSRIRLATPTGREGACIGGSPDLRIAWSEVIALMAKSEQDAGTRHETFFWLFNEQPDPALNAVHDPCGDPPPDGPSRNVGYRIAEGQTITAAARIYEMRTEHGRTFSRWNQLGAVANDLVLVNTWQLKYEAQMKDYQGEVTVYPKDHVTSIPYGNWMSGPGEWWVRALDIDVGFPVGNIGDVFLGNTGGGVGIPYTHVFATLAPIFNWTYP